MKIALITGISGQDGSYLAEFLLAKGYQVIGATRNVGKTTEHLPIALKNKVELVEWNMLDQQAMESVLARCRPSEFYNFSAYSSGSGMYDDPVGIGEINGLAVVRMLEAVRKTDPAIRFCQASSREVFGEATESPQTENTAANPRSPYGAAKLYADAMIRIFREHYGLFACSAILFNHESPRRGLEFVTRKISHGAARIKHGLASELRLGNLDTRRDWGFAGDYVEAMWLMLQQPGAGDFVVATGETHTVREFCEQAFLNLDLDYRDYVREDRGAFRPSEPLQLVGDAGKARQLLNWKPSIDFRELVRMMVDNDVRLIKNERGSE